MGNDGRDGLVARTSGCELGCNCCDLHGLTKDGHRHPLGHFRHCKYCGVRLKHPGRPEPELSAFLCGECQASRDEAAQILRGMLPQIEDWKIRATMRRAAQFATDINLDPEMAAAIAGEELQRMCLLRYVERGPALVPRE